MNKTLIVIVIVLLICIAIAYFYLKEGYKPHYSLNLPNNGYEPPPPPTQQIYTMPQFNDNKQNLQTITLTTSNRM